MDPNAHNPPAALAVPPSGETAAPEGSSNSLPESTEGLDPNAAPAPAPTPKLFTQEEVDTIVGKRLAKEQRRLNRQVESPPPAAAPEVIKPEQFETPEAYAEAVAEQRIAQREALVEESKIAEAYEQREEAAVEKYPDFEQVAYNPQLPVTDVMAKAIRASDIGPDILYTLGTDPKEAARIAKLPPFLQIKEIGKLEGKLVSAPPPVKKVTAVPPPIRPVNAASARPAGEPSFDTTDPRSIQTMTTSQWIEADRQRQVKKAQAQRTH
jgi:hypothetical protein